MSRNVSSTLKTHIALGCTTLARILTITLKNGVVQRFTDHDVELVVGGNTFIPQDGVRFASVYSSVGAGIQNTSLTVIFTSDGVPEVNVVRGGYDGAGIRIELVNWANPALGTIIVFVGTISIIGNNHKGSGVFEVRGLLHRADRVFGELYSPVCRADLGDHRCTVDIASMAQVLTAGSITNASIFVGTVPVEEEAEHFAMGVLTWLTGDNAGLSMEIMQDNIGGLTRTIYLALPMPYTILAGDTATIYPGCDKLIPTCGLKFNNTPNFRGEPPMVGAGFV